MRDESLLQGLIGHIVVELGSAGGQWCSVVNGGAAAVMAGVGSVLMDIV